MDSIIFDLDGTLWDSRETVLVAWNQVIKQHTEEMNELNLDDFKKTMGLQMKEIGQILFPELSDEKRDDLLQRCCELECNYLRKQGGNLYENIHDVLETLAQKYKLLIVSNCQEGYIEAFLEYHQLSKYFLDYENPGRTGLSKGENIQLVIERNSLSDPVYVGDTEVDQKSAEYAGIPFVLAKYGFGNPVKYDYSIDSFSDLLTLF